MVLRDLAAVLTDIHSLRSSDDTAGFGMKLRRFEGSFWESCGERRPAATFKIGRADAAWRLVPAFAIVETTCAIEDP